MPDSSSESAKKYHAEIFAQSRSNLEEIIGLLEDLEADEKLRLKATQALGEITELGDRLEELEESLGEEMRVKVSEKEGSEDVVRITFPEEESETSSEVYSFPDSPSTHDPETTSSEDMTREELKAHLDATEERVRRMTEGVSDKLDKHLEVIQESNERFKAEVREDLAVMKESNKWTYRLSAATLTVLIIVVGLIGILLGG